MLRHRRFASGCFRHFGVSELQIGDVFFAQFFFLSDDLIAAKAWSKLFCALTAEKFVRNLPTLMSAVFMRVRKASLLAEARFSRLRPGLVLEEIRAILKK